MSPQAEAPRAPAPLPPWQLFVGRTREVQELGAVADDLGRGRGRLVLITGEAGIGKTRLAEETAGRAAAAGARVIWGQCWEAGGAPAYWPWSLAMRRLALAGGDAAWQAWSAGLERDLAPLAPDSAAPEAPRSDAEAARFATFDAATRLLRRAAADQPLLVVLEDLHAADLPSLLLLEFVAGEIGDVPLAVVGTYRPGEAERRAAIGAALGRLARSALSMPVAGLTAPDVSALLAAGGGAAADDLVAAVHDATAGNPLFVVETARALHVAHPTGLVDLSREELHITGGVRDAVRPRLALLSPPCRALLELAAVFGDQADLADLQLASGAPLAAVRDAVREGIAAGVLADTAAAAHGVTFRHALLRDVLVEDLPPPRRRALHLAAGDALAQRHAADPGPHLPALAHHFREGAEDAAAIARALDYGVRAARRAAALCADEEAATAYRQALDLLARQSPADAARRGVLQVELGEALTRLGEHDEARGALRAAAATARAADDGALLGRAALGLAERDMGVRLRVADDEVVALCEEALAMLPPDDSALRVRLQARAAIERAVGDDRDRAVAACAGAVAIARRIGDPHALAHALSAHHFALWKLDLPGDRLGVASEIVDLGTALGDDDLVIQGRTWRLYDHMRSGDAFRLDDEIAAFSELAERLRRPRYRWLAANARVMRALWQGRFADAEAGIEAALAFADRIEDPTVRLNPSIQLFLLRREQGRLEEQEWPVRMVATRFPDSPVPRTFLALLCVDLGRLDEAREAFEAVAAQDFADLRREARIAVLPALSEVCAALGDARRAAPLAALLEPYADLVVPYSSSACLGVGAHPLALLAETMGRHDQARALAEQAVARHATMDAPPWLARSRLLLARLLARAGAEPVRARELAAAAHGVAAALGMRAVAADAAALLASLEEPAPLRAAPRHGTFRRDGDHWLIGDGERAPLRLRPCKGFRYIAALLRTPGRALAATDLAGVERHAGDEPYAELAALRDELEEAERFNDVERAGRLRAALAQRAERIAPSGRRRPGSTPAERARLNVTRTIADAVRRIATGDPALGRHFESTIRTGTLCSYVPDPRHPIDWQL